MDLPETLCENEFEKPKLITTDMDTNAQEEPMQIFTQNSASKSDMLETEDIIYQTRIPNGILRENSLGFSYLLLTLA